MAFFTIADVLADFSNCVAIRSKATSRLPEASPASTICTIRDGKILGYIASELANVSPFSTLTLTPSAASRSRSFSVCSVSIFKASEMVTPAFVMLTNCLQKTLISRGLGQPPTLILMSFVRADWGLMLITCMPCFFRTCLAASILSASTLPLISFPALFSAS